MPNPLAPAEPVAARPHRLTHPAGDTHVTASGTPGSRRFTLVSGDQTREVAELPGRPVLRSGSDAFDALFALALEEVRQLSVSNIHAHAFDHGRPVQIEAFETGELWQYVWTRDVAYAIDLALAGLDTPRCVNSLLYKTSDFKPALDRPGTQILQDTGSGGSYPVSTDRVVWALAAERVRQAMPAEEQRAWVEQTLPILCDTIEQDRVLVFDEDTGLYRGEQSFLDWREQTYPLRTENDTLAIAMSPSLSTNVTHFLLLKIAANWLARGTGFQPVSADNKTRVENPCHKYRQWADALAMAINRELWDDEAGQYSGYLLVEETKPIRVRRYDLLGNCLAILTGIASTEQAHRVLNTYPTGPFGPPVVWPQESTVPIYHNHAIWPFVTAYWAKAARHCGHERAVAAAIDSMAGGAARHLSNMENLDYRSGHTDGHSHGLSGPKINSRRQLWSVAGYVGVVRDVLFGMETTDHGVRFRPCLPAETRTGFLPGQSSVRLDAIDYHGKRIDVVVEWPADAGDDELEIADAELNGRAVGQDFVSVDRLGDTNQWTVRLRSTGRPAPGGVPLFTDFANPRALFGPPTPEWRALGHSGITRQDGRLTLHYEPVGDRNVAFNVYRDGQRVARGVTALDWTDPQPPADGAVPEYAVEAVYPETGTASYPSAVRWYAAPISDDTPPRRPATVLCGPDAAEFTVHLPPGRHLIRLRYANGNGAINTGLTCAVKRVNVTDSAGNMLGVGYATMPQTGGHNVFQLSSPITVTTAGGPAVVRVADDPFALNMSYFRHNTVYTGHEGGGPAPCNCVTLDGVVTRPA